ncbi:phosphotransferase family protein [Kitasatospora sp. NPDC001175]|uniref:phosphotransferase family protein n=1 Tax=Kitasatospora sp. NPDC001175 TaxID=3157103 RepID=UPI003CFDF742
MAEAVLRRTVRVLVTWRGERIGVLGPFPVESGWWHDVAPVAAGAEAVLGVPVLVLRLVSVAGGEGGRGGLATYHAEATARPLGELAAFGDELGKDPLRSDWATAEGLRAALDWADDALRASGRPATGPVEQVKSWNLSGLYRIPTAKGPAWLKTTPSFGAAEARVIDLFGSMDPQLVPVVLAADGVGRRLLLDHVPGEDCWGLPDDSMLSAIERLVAAQAALAGRAAASGLDDRTPGRLVSMYRELLLRTDELGLTSAELAQAEHLSNELPYLAIELAACGLPETVLHGDFHPGNWRFDGWCSVLVDFSDACLGNPAFDGLRPRAFLSEERWAQVRERWIAAWSAHVPGSDPARALEVAGPLMHLAYAVRYQTFLDNIEAGERIYHEGDPAAELRRAIASYRAVGSQRAIGG